MTDTKPIVIGKFGAAHGLEGWVKVYSYSQPANNLLSYSPWLVQHKDHWQEMKMRRYRENDQHLVVLMDGIADRNAARALTNKEIAITRAQLPELEEGNYYWRDLFGFTVQNGSGKLIGTLRDLFESPAQDIMMIDSQEQPGKDVLIPWVEGPIVKSVDKDKRLIIVDWEDD